MDTDDDMHTRRFRIFVFGLSAVAGIFALMPWLGVGPYAFTVPGWNIMVPRLDIVPYSISKPLFNVISLPLFIIGEIPYLDRFVFFSGEGNVAARPFVAFIFWFLTSLVCYRFASHYIYTPDRTQMSDKD